jgi:hypothetical protein
MRIRSALAAMALAMIGVVSIAPPAAASTPLCQLVDQYCGPENVMILPMTLAHIQPWANADCSTYVPVGSPVDVKFQTNPTSGPTTWLVGTAQWRYGTYGTCDRYQWIHFHIDPTQIIAHNYTIDMLIWLNGGSSTAHWTVSFTGGQADGDFLSWAVKAGASKTKAWIMHGNRATAPYQDVAWFGYNSLVDWCSTC